MKAQIEELLKAAINNDEIEPTVTISKGENNGQSSMLYEIRIELEHKSTILTHFIDVEVLDPAK